MEEDRHVSSNMRIFQVTVDLNFSLSPKKSLQLRSSWGHIQLTQRTNDSIIHMVLVLPGMWEVRSVSVKDASPEILE